MTPGALNKEWLYSVESDGLIDGLLHWALTEIVEADDPKVSLLEGAAELEAMAEAIGRETEA